MYKLISLLSIALLFVQCTQPNSGEIAKEIPLPSVTKNQGEKYMRQVCYACHNPSTSMDNRAAPPMIAISRRYKMQGYNEQEFVNAIIDYVQHPSEEKSIMPGAVQRFGVMPNMYLEDSMLREIALYLYHNEPEKPDWFEAHFEQEHGQKKQIIR